jgi:hypothetical protein
MPDAQHIGVKPPYDFTPKQAHDARARAWAYVFACFNRRAKQEGSPTLATLKDTRGESKHDSCTEFGVP